MDPFKKLPGFVRSPPGMERRVLARLPRILLLGTVLLCLPALAVRLYVWLADVFDPTALVTTVDIFTIGLVILHWTVVVVVAFYAFIVFVMKGPAYVADPYPLEDADKPAEHKR